MRIITILLASLVLWACQKEPVMGSAPNAADAVFTYSVSAGSDNIIVFSASSDDKQYLWDLGNGIKKQGSTVSAEYPYAGTYIVKLTVFGEGGSVSSTQSITIDQDDLSLLNNPIYSFLTGGVSGQGFKVWHVDSASTAHIGVGPDPESAAGSIPEWWSSNPNEKPGCGIYDDRYVFHLNGFKFDMINNGDVYIHNSLASLFPGSFQNLFDYTAPYTDQLNQSWQLNEGTENYITVSGNSFIGFYTGVKTYRIISITDTTLNLQYQHHEGGLLWYLKLKSE